MKKMVLGIALCSGLVACNEVATTEGSDREQTDMAAQNQNGVAPEVTVGQYEALMSRVQQSNDTTYVLNFWATWCGPCVKELPHFKALSERMKASGKPFRLIMVSLDPAGALEEKVIPFLKEKNIAAEQYLLDDNGRMNEWIPAFNKDWTGAIPVTIIYRKGVQLAFHEGAVDAAGLDRLVQPYIQ